MLKENRRLKVFDGCGISLSAFLPSLLISIILTQIAYFIWGDGVEDNVAFNYIFNALFLVLIAAGVVVYANISRYNPFETSKFKGRLSVSQIAWLLPISILCIVAFMPLAEIFVKLLGLLGYSPQPSDIGVSDGVGMLFLNIFCVAVLPAFCEEFVFRGNAASAFKSKSPIFGMVLSSLIFGFFHLSALQLVHQALLGAVMCYVFYITRSFWSAFIIHFLNNTLALILEFALKNVEFTNSVATGAGAVAAFFFICVGISIVGILLLLTVLRVFTNITRKELGKRDGVAYQGDAQNPFVGALKDFARAFYPNGIKENIKNLNATILELSETPEEKEERRKDDAVAERSAELVGGDDNENVLRQIKFEETRDKRRDRNGLIAVAFVIGATWLFFVISDWVRGGLSA